MHPPSDDSLEVLRRTFADRRFLIVIGTFANLGGAERQALLLGEFLKKKIGAQVTFLAAYKGALLEEKLDSLDIEHVVVPFEEHTPATKKLVQILRLIPKIRNLRPEFIIPFIAFNSKVVGLIWKFTGARYALWNQRDEGRRLYGSRLDRLALRNVCDIVSNSWAGRDALVEKCGVRPEDVVIINNGVVIPETDRFQPVWREKLGLPPETLLVAMIANLTRYKDHATLLRAWKIVENHFAGQHRAAALILAGRPAETADALKILAFDLGLRSVYMPGRVDDVHGLLHDCDLVAHSSRFEGCPNGVLEAMALARPVVGTDIPGLRQALGDSASAECLAPPGNAKTLAEKIIVLLTAPEQRRDIGRRNRSRIKEHFSINSMGAAYLRLIARRGL